MADNSNHSYTVFAPIILSVCSLALSAATLGLLVESRHSSSGVQSSPSATTYPWLSLPTAPSDVVGSIQGITLVFRSDSNDVDGDGKLDEARIHHHTIQRIHQIDQNLALVFLNEGVDNFVAVDHGQVFYRNMDVVMDASAGGGFTSSVTADWDWDIVGTERNRERRLSSTVMSSHDSYLSAINCNCGGNLQYARTSQSCETCY